MIMTRDEIIVHDVKLSIKLSNKDIRRSVKWLQEYLNNEDISLEDKARAIIREGDELKEKQILNTGLLKIVKRAKDLRLTNKKGE